MKTSLKNCVHRCQALARRPVEWFHQENNKCTKKWNSKTSFFKHQKQNHHFVFFENQWCRLFEHPIKQKNVFEILKLVLRSIFKKKIENNFVHKMRFPKSRIDQLFYFIRSSYDIDRYILRYLRVSRGTLRQFKTKRIEETFSKIIFPVARHPTRMAASELST